MSFHRLFIITFIFTLCACAYRPAASKGVRIQDIQTVAIPMFKNNTTEVGLEVLMTQALLDEFLRSKQLRVVSQGQADAILVAEVNSLQRTPIAFQVKRNLPSTAQYRVSVDMSAKLLKQPNREIIINFPHLSDFEEYNAGSSILLRESAQQQALKSIARDLMEELHDRIVEAW